MPGGAFLHSVASYTEQYVTLSPTELGMEVSDQPWNVEVFVRQDPVLPVSVRVTRGADTFVASWGNSKFISKSAAGLQRLTFAEVNAGYKAFMSRRQAYRITALGVTGTHVASALTDEGIITAAQYSVPQAEMMLSRPYAAHWKQDAAECEYGAGIVEEFAGQQVVYPSAGAILRFNSKALLYRDGPWQRDSIMQATNSYTGKAKEGFYVPLKLDTDHRMIPLNTPFQLGGNTTYYSDIHDCASITTNVSESEGQSTPAEAWPYYCKMPDDYPSRDSDFQYDAGMISGFETAANSVAHVSVRGLNPKASINLVLRLSVEFLPDTSSPEAAYARPAAPPDAMAIKMYTQLAASLPDAFPADYNDRGKLMNLISRVARTIAPALNTGLSILSAVPGAPGLIGKAGSALLGVAMSKRKSDKAKPQVKAPPAPPKTQIAIVPAKGRKRGGRGRRRRDLDPNFKLVITRPGQKTGRK